MNEGGEGAWLLTALAVTTLLGAMASVPLLSRGRRLNRRRLAEIESRMLRGLGIAILTLTSAVIVLLSLILALGLLGPATALLTYALVRTGLKSDPERWRAPLYTMTAFVLLVLLMNLWG